MTLNLQKLHCQARKPLFLSCVVVYLLQIAPFVLVAAMDISELTEEALFAMQAKDFERAIQYLKEALALSRQRLATDDSVAAPPTGDGVVMGCRTILSDLELARVEDVSANNDFLIFDRVFVPTNQDSPARQSMACLYNIAVCYHLHALHKARDGTTIMQRAIYFYSIGINTTAEMVQDQDPDPFVVVLYLAFLNNLGHIRSHVGDYEQADWYSRAVYSTLITFLRQRGVVDPVTTTMEHIPPAGVREVPTLAFSFFCPLRFYSAFQTLAAAA